MCCFGCLFWMAMFVKDIAFIWQSHLTSTLFAVEKSSQHEAGCPESEKCLFLITCPKTELNELQPHTGSIETKQGDNPVVQEIFFCPKNMTFSSWNQVPQSLYCVDFVLEKVNTKSHTISRLLHVFFLLWTLDILCTEISKEWPVVQTECDLTDKRLFSRSLN